MARYTVTAEPSPERLAAGETDQQLGDLEARKRAAAEAVALYGESVAVPVEEETSTETVVDDPEPVGKRKVTKRKSKARHAAKAPSRRTR
jgi:hypothetical protein